MEKLYRFSPIKSEDKLFEAIRYIHFACFKLCKQVFGEYLPVSERVGVFCHYDDEYNFLTKLREKLTDESDNFNQKYFRLHEPITIAAENGVPEATYKYLYIRKPDPYRAQVGDIDFVLGADRHEKLKSSLVRGARLHGDVELNMIELYDPDIDALAYLVTRPTEQALK